MIAIIFGVAGWLGLAIVVLATLKLNDANLYSASLHAANAIEIVLGHKMNRGVLTIILGLVGILFSIFGILQHIVGFLLILGIAVPPIGGVLIVDYFLLARDRQSLAVTRARRIPQLRSRDLSVVRVHAHAGERGMRSLLTAAARPLRVKLECLAATEEVRSITSGDQRISLRTIAAGARAVCAI